MESLKYFFLQKKVVSPKHKKKIAELWRNVELKNVSQEKKYIFLHIPKNAGTSVAKSLNLTATSHHTASQYKELLGGTYSKYYKFCFIRNPWSRFLSLYNYARLEESQYHSAIDPDKASDGKHMDYDLLKNASLNECAIYLLEGKLKHDNHWNQWNPQVNWVLDESKDVIVDYIGRVENFDEDFREVCSLLDIPCNIKRTNASSPQENFSYREAYDDETKKIIEEYYIEDIEKFGYEF